MDRRSFLAASAALPAAALAAQRRLPIKKALYIGMLPSKLSYADRFKLTRDTGFEAIECSTTPVEKEAEEIMKRHGVEIYYPTDEEYVKFRKQLMTVQDSIIKDLKYDPELVKLAMKRLGM